MVNKIYLSALLLIIGMSLPTLAEDAFAFSTAAGGETITWDFAGIPAQSFMIPASPCGYNPDTNFYSCNYGIMDAPYGNEITFTASLQPQNNGFIDVIFGYYDVYDIFHGIVRQDYFSPSSVTISTSFFIPARAKTFALIYNKTGGTGPAESIQLNYQVVNYDPVRANLYGGDDINPDTEYCDDRAQPGRPKIRKFRNKKGAGPGT